MKNKNGEIRRGTFEELIQIETPARIEVHPAATPHDWQAWLRLSGVRPEIAKGLEWVAVEEGASIHDWLVSFNPISINSGHWLAIELFANGQWRDFEEVYPQVARK